MNNKIEPTYATFKQAKWLKEKGFDELCQTYYNNDGEVERYNYYRGDGTGFDKNSSCIENDFTSDVVCIAPEQWLVCEWLRINYGIWIHIYYLTEEKCWGWDCYKYEKEYGLLNEPAISFSMNSQSPQEAINVAINYVLNNLI
jgi:hypothetical protein